MRWNEVRGTLGENVDPLNLSGFFVQCHTNRLQLNGGSRAGYHCADCGLYYVEGNFTIENESFVLGAVDQKECCNKRRPTPRIFETVDEVREFLSNLIASGEYERATLIQKNALILSHFNKELVSEHKRRTLH